MIEEGLYIQEKAPAIYIYRQIMNGREQIGIVCVHHLMIILTMLLKSMKLQDT